MSFEYIQQTFRETAEKPIWLQALSGRIETAPAPKRNWLGVKI